MVGCPKSSRNGCPDNHIKVIRGNIVTINRGEQENSARIKVVGIGGGGSNAVSRMYRERVPGVEYIVVNSDSQALLRSDVPLKMRIGDQLTNGMGVGWQPGAGRQVSRGEPRRPL